MIPPSFIHDLLARADVVELVGRSVQLKKSGANYAGLCPFHSEKSPSFTVSPSKQFYHCFGCGAHGNAIGFLMEHSGFGYVDAIKELASTLGVTVPDDNVSPAERAQAEKAREQRSTLTEVLKKAAQHYRTQLRSSEVPINYLKKRGLSGEIAKRFGLGYAPPGWNGLASVFAQYDDPLLVQAGLVIEKEDDGEHAGGSSGGRRRWDRFRDRVMFPIRDVKGEVIGFGARVMDGGGEPKYLNSPETPVFIKGRELYGLFEARLAIRERGYVLVTEGYMDVVALAQLGFGNAVATLGTACTADHVAKLLRFSQHIVFSFDGDAAGRRAAARAMEAVLGHATDTRSFRFLFLPPEHDPDSFVREQGAAAFEAAIEAAVPLSRQLIDQASVECDLATAEGRSRMLAQARPWIEQLPVGLLREQLLVELAAAGGLGADTLRQHWAAGTAARGPSSGAGRAETRPGGRAQGPDPRRAPAWPGDGDMAGAGGNDPPPPDWPEEASRQGERPPWGASPGGGGWRGEWSRSGQARGGWSRSDRGRGDWPRRESASVGSPRRAPLRAATPLDRAAQILLDQAELWLEHSAEAHGLLCEAPAPYGGFFAAVERVLHDQGPLPAHSLKDEVRKVAQADGSADALLPLLDRLEQLHALEVDGESRSGQLRHILRGLQLEAIKDEIKLLLESGELSDEAQKRRNELMQRRDRLKAGAPD